MSTVGQTSRGPLEFEYTHIWAFLAEPSVTEHAEADNTIFVTFSPLHFGYIYVGEEISQNSLPEAGLPTQRQSRVFTFPRY